MAYLISSCGYYVWTNSINLWFWGSYLIVCRLHLHLSCSLMDRRGPTDDLATSSLHSSRLSAFLMAAPSVMPVHSRMLSSHLFFCLPLLHLPCTVPCRIVLASPVDLVTCPYHFSLLRFTVVKRSSWGPMACRVVFRTSSLAMWSL